MFELLVTTPQGINVSDNFCFLQRLSVIFDFRRYCPWSLASCRDYRPRKMASYRDCPCDSASCRDSRQEAELHGQSLQEAFYQAQQSRQEARNHGQSRRTPNMTDSLCRKRKLADSFIPCELLCWFHILWHFAMQMGLCFDYRLHAQFCGGHSFSLWMITMPHRKK